MKGSVRCQAVRPRGDSGCSPAPGPGERPCARRPSACGDSARAWTGSGHPFSLSASCRREPAGRMPGGRVHSFAPDARARVALIGRKSFPCMVMRPALGWGLPPSSVSRLAIKRQSIAGMPICCRERQALVWRTPCRPAGRRFRPRPPPSAVDCASQDKSLSTAKRKGNGRFAGRQACLRRAGPPTSHVAGLRRAGAGATGRAQARSLRYCRGLFSSAPAAGGCSSAPVANAGRAPGVSLKTNRKMT
jgi:hypothetical protein